MTREPAGINSLIRDISRVFLLLVWLSIPTAAKHNASGSWSAINLDSGATRYSPLAQITPANVGHLKVAWIYHMKPVPAAGAAPDSTWRPSEDQPLVVGDTMFVVTPYSRVVALDAATGREKWVFVIPGSGQASLRGATYWPGDASTGPSLFFGTNHGFLYSISATTGKMNATFGDNGAVNLRTPEVMSTGKDALYILPSPPVIYKNLVITGAGPGEGHGGTGGGLGPAGDTRAWDIHSGKLVWTFHSVPRPGETGHDTWGGDSWKQRSGVNVWGYMTVDQQHGILYMPFGAPNYDRVGTDRPGDNLFGTSVVAADAATGKLLWYFQAVHHDIWDYDTEAPPTLIDVHRDGKTIPAVVIVNKTGLMFVLDRLTGKPLFPVVEKPVPASDVPGEHASPTQPFPEKPEPLAPMTAQLYNDLPEHTAWCKAYVEDNHMLLAQQPYTPPAFERYSLNMPGTHGGVNYAGGAFDPTLGLFVVNVNNLGQPMRIMPDPAGGYANSGEFAGYARFWDPEKRLPCTATPWGELVAIDVNSGEIAWRSTLGVTDDFPADKQHTGRPGLGGPTVTAGGLTFIGATDDARLRAFNTKTGQEVWTYRLPASAEAIPITYTDEHGTQYVAIAATGGGLLRAPLLSDELIAFKLDDGASGGPNIVQASSNPTASQPQPAQPPAKPLDLDDPKTKAMLSSQAAVLPAGPGRDVTIRACSTCHDLDVVASQHLTPQEWTNVVQTMSAKGAEASSAELKLIQSYLSNAFPRSDGQPAASPGAQAPKPPGQNVNGMHIYIWAGLKSHLVGQHDYPQFLADWSKLLTDRGAVVDGSLHPPSAADLEHTDVVVIYKGDAGYLSDAEKAILENYVKRGGGLVSLHDSLCGPDPAYFATLVGGAKKHGEVNYTLGAPIPYTITDSADPIMKGMSNFTIFDEAFYSITWAHDPGIHVLATAVIPGTPSADAHKGEVVPQIWTYEHTAAGGKPARAFVWMQGHEYANFDNYQIQQMLLRGIAWAGHQPVDTLVDYVPPPSQHPGQASASQ